MKATQSRTPHGAPPTRPAKLKAVTRKEIHALAVEISEKAGRNGRHRVKLRGRAAQLFGELLAEDAELAGLTVDQMFRAWFALELRRRAAKVTDRIAGEVRK